MTFHYTDWSGILLVVYKIIPVRTRQRTRVNVSVTAQMGNHDNFFQGIRNDLEIILSYSKSVGVTFVLKNSLLFFSFFFSTSRTFAKVFQ